ncbi:hypothetical protein QUH73_20460 [Labilibaculum sp. K2S]|uniref:SprT-like domain-containing protein n=1 Tax=Labilibaculum sp. K2S TaxID=3056386 RepID=UPI0025A44D0B|nr:SprT-like domain-containing protein [Labilibaculum sp. K2S]MDM8162203.1 hypothetical protein [Labilibaculum sp. K2S]
MKLNFKKPKTRILLAVFLSSLLIYGCGKEEDVIVQPDAKTKNQEFFKHQKTGGDEFKTYILECLAQADDSLSFTGDFVKTYGLPQWDSGMSFNVEDRNSLIIPILDKTNESISALYYLKYSGSDIETYLFMNDHDDAAYSYLSRMIQYFEKIMNLKISNDDIIVTIKGSDGTKKTKARSEIMETCYSWEQLWIDSNGKSHYDPYKECFIHIEVRSDFHTSRGDWNFNSSGNYKPNDSYNGGSGNGNGEPEPRDILPYPGYPAPPVETTQEFDDSKAGCLYTEMRDNDLIVPQSLLDELLKGFEYPDSKTNISYSIEDDLGTDTKGKCKPTDIKTDGYGNLINANFNIIISKRLMNSNSFLATANTILHETIHAHLFGVIYDSSTHATPAENIDFATTYDALQKKYGKEAQHKIMINYIEVMKKNLSDLYNKWPSHEEKVKFIAQVTEKLPGKNLDFIFEVMARSGLKRTAEGKQFYDANKNNYDMVTGFLDECLPVNCPF